MSKQFSILATDVDLKNLQAELMALGDVDILSEVVTNDLQDLQPIERLDIPQSQVGVESLFCYLAPHDLPRNVVAKRISPLKTPIDINASHLIEFWRPYYDCHIIREGRIYYQDRVILEGKFSEKNLAFRKWANKVFVKLKMALKLDRELNTYVAPHAAKKIASGELRVVGKFE